jgi:uncharacterized OsmC-like protein
MSDTFDVQFSFRGEAVGKMRNEVHVVSTAPRSGGTFDIATDEGPAHGGDATAPTPLHYFTAALAGCLMTQVRAFAKRLGVQLDGLVVEGTTAWLGHLTSPAPYWTEPVRFDLQVHVDSPASTDEVVALVEAAKKGCFVEQTLARGVTVGHTVVHGEAVRQLHEAAA